VGGCDSIIPEGSPAAARMEIALNVPMRWHARCTLCHEKYLNFDHRNPLQLRM